MMQRRRFLAITAAALALPARAQATTWQGRAFGADVGLTFHAPHAQAQEAIAQTRRIITRIEALFSLYDPTSALSRLNRSGQLFAPAPGFLSVMQAADNAHHLTEGLFDPTVQPLWRALAEGRDTASARQAVGWSRLHFDAQAVTLAPGQALTFNGIAQGFATDRVTTALQALGLTDVLVNIGEHRGIGGPWRLGLADPVHGLLGQHSLRDAAVATSSPAALPLADGGHIMLPGQRPRWSTVSVTARSATLADALSTALCLAPRALIEEVARSPDILAIRVVDHDGHLTTI